LTKAADRANILILLQLKITLAKNHKLTTTDSLNLETKIKWKHIALSLKVKEISQIRLVIMLQEVVNLKNTYQNLNLKKEAKESVHLVFLLPYLKDL
jgi:hypothetical protein